MHGFMETYSRWDQVLTTSLWALTTVCRQRWGELTHNGSTKNDEDVWARGGSITCLLLKGRMLSVWQCFLQTTWYFPSSFLIFSSSNSHPKFLPTHPKNQAFIGISAKKHISNFNYFHILSRWSSIGFKLPIAFPLAPTAVELGTSFPGQERRGRWTTWPIEASATCVVSWCVKRIGTILGSIIILPKSHPMLFKPYLSTTFQWWCSISESNMAVFSQWNIIRINMLVNLLCSQKWTTFKTSKKTSEPESKCRTR